MTGEFAYLGILSDVTDLLAVVELKNDLCLIGTLKSVDQFLNIKLDNVKVLDEQRYPHMVSLISVSIKRRSNNSNRWL